MTASAAWALAVSLALLVLWPSWLIHLVLQPLLPEVLFCGGDRRRQPALTIDDGPSWALQPGDPTSLGLLDLLGHLQVPATCCAIASRPV